MPTLEQLRARDYHAAQSKGPTGLGGWLILPMIGMFLTPAINLWSLPEYFSLLGPDYALTTQQTFAVRFELAQALAMSAVPIGLLVLFFNRKRQFPPAHIAWQVVNLIWTLMVSALTYSAFREYHEATGASFWDDGTGSTLAGQLASTCIWTGYLLNSTRVRNTFVR